MRRAYGPGSTSRRVAHRGARCARRAATARPPSELLGIGRRTLYAKMEKLGIAPKFSPGSRADTSFTRERARQPQPTV